MTTMNPKLVQYEESMSMMDTLFDGFFEWLADQYDPTSGGFFYARSSKTSGQFTPDIESTAQALNMIDRCCLLPDLPDGMKGKLIHFFQGKQDPSTGYFLDEDPNMKDDDVMVGRAIAYSMNALRRLGAQPLYALPGDANAAPAYMASAAKYAEWLESISLVNSWRGCDRLCNSAPYIAELTGQEQAAFLQTALDYFGRIQDPETGLWGEGAWYVRVSGSFKLLTFYNRFSVPMPRAAEMYESLRYTLRHENAKDMCYIRNPIDLLASMKRSFPLDELQEIVDITIRNMQRLKRTDGGFSRELEHSPKATNVAQVKSDEYYPDMPKPVPLGLGLVEGDMNAATQAILIRHLCRRFAGLPAVPPPQVRQGLFDSVARSTE
ncbi:hypothetical protein [Paenibacillus sp. YYML68]|uniref:hypothetical protein n=1 Tax=Paenibacillus sp. YYML68 TaxID=2909250 RepID=UPI0024917BA6|nr:hypothetical protein [Paenibacillus sp. YYML68]